MRRTIAEGELLSRFPLHSFGAFTAFGFSSVWSMLRERESFGLWSQKPHVPGTFLCFTLFQSRSHSCFSFCLFFLLNFFLHLTDSHVTSYWGVYTLHATEGSQLHRCVVWLAVFVVLAWSNHPSRTTGPDEELERLHLAASLSTWGFCPHTATLPSLRLSSRVFFWK